MRGSRCSTMLTGLLVLVLTGFVPVLAAVEQPVLMRIEVEDRDSLDRLIKMDLDITPTYIDLADLDPSDRRTGYGSPTMLIDGEDMLGVPLPNVGHVPPFLIFEKHFHGVGVMRIGRLHFQRDRLILVKVKPGPRIEAHSYSDHEHFVD